MYLHIGNQINIRERDIVGIFDADRTTTPGSPANTSRRPREKRWSRRPTTRSPNPSSSTATARTENTRSIFPSSPPPPSWDGWAASAERMRED